MAQSIAITGSGIICSIGADCASVLDALKNNKSGIAEPKYIESLHKELPVGEVKFSNNELKASLGLDMETDYSRTTMIGAIALRQALNSAGITPEMIVGKKVVFVSGTTVGGMDITERYYSSMKSSEGDASYVVHHDCGSNTQEIAEICGLDCEMTTISTACSSALNAIVLGVRMLLSKEADLVIAGGTEALSRFHLNGFNSLLILDSERCRPFDVTRRGLNLGEGAAYVAIERTEDAKNREANILCYIGGWGNRCDAYHQTATSENGEGAYLAMKDAINMAKVDPKDIDYINAHGTGTPDNDKSESAAVNRLFGEFVPAMSSTKSFTGHTTSASGSIETVICLLAMHNKFIPANLGWKVKDNDCITPSLGNDCIELHNVLCNSFGFGGNDTSILISDKEVKLIEIEASDTQIAAEYEVTSDETLQELRQFVSPMESRRMSRIIKASLLSSLKVMEIAGITTIDAIIIGTQYGMLEQCEKILDYLCTEGEENLSPTLFMQSTHNTIAGTLAIRTKCHGYNITYSHGVASLDWAIREANRLISEGKANTVLVGMHDQCPNGFRTLFKKAGLPEPPDLYSKSLIIKKHRER